MTIAQIKSTAKQQGFEVSRANANVNGKEAYTVVGRPGLYTKSGLIELIGLAY